MLINKNNQVLISKSISLAIRSFFVLFLYKNSLFEFLGLYSIVNSISVVATGLIGLEIHMISNRDMAKEKSKKTQLFPMYYHTVLVLFITIITTVFCLIVKNSEWSAIIVLTGSYYILAELIRFFNFSGKIVLSANLNLIRDVLIIFAFIGYNIDTNYFFPLALLQLILVVYILYKTNNLKQFNLKEWFHQIRCWWQFSKYFYLNVISRNVLAYADRFLVLSISGLDGLGKYTLLAYVNTSAVTLLSGSVVYTRIPLLLKKSISRNKFFKKTFFKSNAFLILIWTAFYFLYPFLNLPEETFNINAILIFVFYGSSMLFFGILGQIIYSEGRDKYLVFTSIFAAIITLISAIFVKDVYIHLCVTTLILIILGIHRAVTTQKHKSIN